MAAPLLIEIILITSLALLLVQCDKESDRETKYRRCAAIGAKLISLCNDSMVSIFASFQGEAKVFLQIYENDIKKIDQRKLQLVQVSKGDKLAETSAKQLTDTLDDLLPVLGKVAAPVKRGERLVEMAETLNEIKDEFQNLRDICMARMSYVSKLQEMIAENSTRRREKLQFEQREILALGLAANLIAGFFLLVFYRNSISKRLQIVMDNTRLLAEGSTLKPPLSGADEISQLDQAFHLMDGDLKKAAERERSLFENASDVICVLNKDLIFQRINPACERLWGYAPSKLIGTSVIDLIHPNDKEEAKNKLSKSFESTSLENIELRLLSAKEEHSESLWSSYFSKSDESLYCIVHDISERKQLERMKQSFITMMSSDLRQPLSAIANDVSKLLGPLKEELSNKARSRLETVNKNLGRLVTLVDELLHMSQTQSAALKYHLQSCRIDEAIQRSIQDIEGLAQQKRIKFVVESEADQWYVDPNKIMQVIINLASNAIKFSAEGSEVKFKTKSAGQFVEFQVIDKGRGVPESHWDTIFEKFKQVEAKDGERKTGTGLGLPICKEIIEENAGEIGVWSKEGEGSKFWFRVPADEAAYNETMLKRKEAKEKLDRQAELLISEAQQIRLPAKSTRTPGMNLSLLKKGVVLIGVPIIFELVFVLGISSLLNQTEKSRSEEQHQRQIASTAYSLLDAYFTLSVIIVRNKSYESWMVYDKVCESIISEGKKLEELVKDDPVASLQLSNADKIHKKVLQKIYEGRRIVQDGYTRKKGEIAIIDRFELWAFSAGLARKLNKLIDDAEKKEFVSPESINSLRNLQGTLLLCGLSANILLSLFLAQFFSKDITSRLAAQADNAGRLARDLPLNPVFPGKDEIAQLDRAFHASADKLAEARKKERAVFDNSKDLICVLDSQGQFLSFNRSCEELFGFGDELRSSKMIDLLDDNYKDAFTKVLNADDLGAGKSLELDFMREDGSKAYLMMSFSRPNKESNLYCIGHDISARKELERLKQEFLSVVSHDLRSPLTSMIGIAEIIESGATGEVGAKAKELVHDIIVQGDQLIELINDLLDLEKFEANKMQLLVSKTSAKNILDESVKKASAKSSQISYSMTGLSDAGDIMVDPARITQALSNILTYITQKELSPAKIEIETAKTKESLIWKITDNSRALSESEINSLFQRTIATTRDKLSVSKLALPLAKRIIEAHDGSLTVLSFESGYQFVIKLPA